MNIKKQLIMNQLYGNEPGSYSQYIHCNLGQSSNDSFPTAMHIAIIIQSYKKLIPYSLEDD